MLLFRSEEHIDRWCGQWNMPRGATLSLEQGWELAQEWYSRVREVTWRRKTLEEAEATLARIGLTGPFWQLRPG